MLMAHRIGAPEISSSQASTPSEDTRKMHWTKKVPIPSIHLTDDEARSSHEDQHRPQSPNVEQIAERNQKPSPPLISTSTVKKKGITGKNDDFSCQLFDCLLF